MEKNGTPLAAGLGGAVLVAMLAGPFSGGHAGPSEGGTLKTPTGTTARMAEKSVSTLNFNQDGPWYAICREYVTKEPDTEGQPDSHEPGKPLGFVVHMDPPKAQEDMKEFRAEKQRIEVSHHFSADLSACTKQNPQVVVKMVIATVPDPLASHMQLMTDRAIDAIGLGAATEGFHLTSYWLPWRTTGPEGATRDGDSDELAQSRLQEPGVLIYKKVDNENPTGKSLLFILLVGETPTYGINRLQMARAVRDASEIRAAETAEAAEPLLLLGPNFSSSYGSLAEVLRSSKWMNEQPRQAMSGWGKVIAVSPATSSAPAISRFRRLESSAVPCVKEKSDQAAVRLASLSLSEDQVSETILSDLADLSIPKGATAWLSEDESFIGDEEAKLTGSDPEPTQKASDGGLHLRYPRDLSTLRNNADPGALLVTPADLKGTPETVHGVALSLAEKSFGAVDSPPSYAANQEAIRAEAALERLVEHMQQRHVQAIVIEATNPLDQLFLLDYMHRSMPDARLVTVEADEFMMLRPSHVSLLGTLVVSGIPLLAGEQTNHTAKGEGHLTVNFPGSDAASAYLGIRILLQEPVTRARALAGLEPDYGRQVLTDARWASSLDAKAMDKSPWPSRLGLKDVSTFLVGRHGLEPFTGGSLFTHYPVGEDEVFVRSSVNPFPIGWLISLVFLALLTLWHLLALREAERHTPASEEEHGGAAAPEACLTERGGPKWAYPAAPNVKSKNEEARHEWSWDYLAASRRYFLYVACNQVTLLQFAACSATLILWRRFGGTPNANSPILTSPAWMNWIKFVAVINLMLFVISLTASIRRGWSLRLGGGRLPLPIILFTHLFPIASGLTWAVVLAGHPHRDGFFTIQSAGVALRCVQLTHGLSPFVPFATLLLAYLMWAWLNLHRVAIALSGRVWIEPRILPAEGVLSAKGILTKLHLKLHKELQSCLPLMDERQAFILVIWFFGLVMVDGWSATRGIDGNLFRLWALAFGMFPLLYTCALDILWAYRRWWALKGVLDYLERSPIALEFSKDNLSTEIASMKIWQVGGMPRSLLIQSHILDEFEEKDRRQGEKYVEKWLELDGAGVRGSSELCEKMSEVLNRPLEEHARILESPAMPENMDYVDWQGHARYLTLRYVALIPYALLQIRNSLVFVVWGAAAAVLCVASYPFQGEHVIGGFISIVCIGMMAAIALLLVKIERHPLLSRLEGTKAGEASFLQVAGQLLSIGGLPLMAVLASQFPAMGDFLLSWVKPVMEAGH